MMRLTEKGIEERKLFKWQPFGQRNNDPIAIVVYIILMLCIISNSSS